MGTILNTPAREAAIDLGENCRTLALTRRRGSAAAAERIRQKLVELFLAVENALGPSMGKVVEFIGYDKSAGASTLMGELARVTANDLRKRVLYAKLDPSLPGLGALGKSVEEAGAREVRLPCGDPAWQLPGNGSLVAWQFANGVKDVSSVLNTDRFYQVLGQVRPHFDIILLDAAPFGVSPDALMVASKIDGTVLVLEAERTRWQVADAMKEKIERHNGKVLGAVLNKRREHIPRWIYNLL